MTAVPVPVRHFTKLNISERMFAHLLQNYLLTRQHFIEMGYPIDSGLIPGYQPGAVVLFKTTRTPYVHLKTNFDVNAREFVPRSSGSSSGNSSDSNSDPMDDSDDSFILPYKKCDMYDDVAVERSCVRCGSGFFTTRTEYLTHAECSYHWGKLRQASKREPLAYSCCDAKIGTRGCTPGKYHVWNGVMGGLNGPYYDYVRTKHRKSAPADGNYGVYALDCEMCYTVAGLEVTKVTVVAMDGRLVYDTFVRPENEIVDYNTRFSGISAKDFQAGSKRYVKSLRDVQNDLMGFISASTILIGHGLENDLRALKVLHYACVDTALTFPHFNGLPYRRSLKSLCGAFLKRDIQTREQLGHNSYEDAAACMELMLWLVRNDFRHFFLH